MDEEILLPLWPILQAMAILNLAGFIIGPLLLGLTVLYDRKAGKASTTLKYLTFGPLLVAIVVGQLIYISFFPFSIICYALSGLFACIGSKFLFSRPEASFRKRLVGSSLLTAAALPSILAGFGFFVNAFIAIF